MKIKVVAGIPLHCHREDNVTKIDNDNVLGTVLALAFAPNGDLYIAESDTHSVYYVRVIDSAGKYLDIKIVMMLKLIRVFVVQEKSFILPENFLKSQGRIATVQTILPLLIHWVDLRTYLNPVYVVPLKKLPAMQKLCFLQMPSSKQFQH